MTKYEIADYVSIWSNKVEGYQPRIDFINQKIAQYNQELEQINKSKARDKDILDQILALQKEAEICRYHVNSVIDEINKLVYMANVKVKELTDEEVEKIVRSPNLSISSLNVISYSPEEYDRLSRIRDNRLEDLEKLESQVKKLHNTKKRSVAKEETKEIAARVDVSRF